MERVTEVEAAGLAGVARSTFRAYVSRGQAPAPVGYSGTTGLREWDRADIEHWLANRPGRGVRTAAWRRHEE